MTAQHRHHSAIWTPVHALTVLAEAGSFTAAAQRLGISKAAMSLRIADLEKAAGLPLVHRSTRSVQLTEAGRQLADGTRAAFNTIAEAFSSAQDRAGEPAGLLRLTAPVAYARQCLMPLLPGFLHAHPRIQLELDLSDRLRPLAQDGFDLAIRHTTAPPETHVAWRLHPTRSLLVASPDYLARRGAPAMPADLSQHDCLFYPRAGEAAAWSFEPREGDSARLSVALHGPLSANNSEMLREAALAGMGVALLPDFSASAALRQGAWPRCCPTGARSVLSVMASGQCGRTAPKCPVRSRRW